MRHDASIDVIIPVHGKWNLTRECLLSLRQQSVRHNVIVVDDAGGDETGQEIARYFPDVTVVTLAHNSGFGTACNAGIRAGTAPIVVLLNNDTTAEPAFLEEIAAAFDQDESIGSVAPLVLTLDGRIEALGFTIDRTLSGHHRLKNEPLENLDDESFLLCGAYGAAAGFRRIALDDVGLFDENIFMYQEELDLALRLTSARWKIVAAPQSRVTHASGATVELHSARQRRYTSFSRGYIIRAYRLLNGRVAARVITIEILRCIGSLAKYRDTIALTERIRGWKVGAQASARPAGPLTSPSIDTRVTLLQSFLLRIRLNRGRTTRHRTTSTRRTPQ